jgi:hypothetical protein
MLNQVGNNKKFINIFMRMKIKVKTIAQDSWALGRLR